MENAGEYYIFYCFIISLCKEANCNIYPFPFGEIQTPPHFAQKALNNDVIF